MNSALGRISTFSVVRRLATLTDIVGAGTTTGIEHALKQREIGQKHKQDFKDYKCIDYLHYDQFSFYNKEKSLEKHRVPQPSNTKPDVEPKLKNAS